MPDQLIEALYRLLQGYAFALVLRQRTFGDEGRDSRNPQEIQENLAQPGERF